MDLPLEILQTLAPAGSSANAPARNQQPRGGRRFSVALAAVSSVVARRNSTGGILMLSHGLPSATTPVPALTASCVARLAAARSISALKTLRGALQLAQRGSDGAMVRQDTGNVTCVAQDLDPPAMLIKQVELVASATWNAALPVLGRLHAATVTPVLDAAATALASVDSNLCGLRVVSIVQGMVYPASLQSVRYVTASFSLTAFTP